MPTPIDAEATANRDAVAAAVRSAGGRVPPEQRPTLAGLTNKEFSRKVKAEYGFDPRPFCLRSRWPSVVIRPKMLGYMSDCHRSVSGGLIEIRSGVLIKLPLETSASCASPAHIAHRGR